MDSTKIFVQARNNSSRLKGKMTLPFYKDKSILEIILERLGSAFQNKDIVLATTTSHLDDNLIAIANKYNIQVYRGSESDVLSRFVEAGKLFKCQNIIRVCADNPFLDLESLQILFEKTEKTGKDYIGFELQPGLPSIKSHIGFFAEGVKLAALQKVAISTVDSFYHEHVTNYIYANPSKFAIDWLDVPEKITGRTDLRFTVDTLSDFKMASEIFAEMEKSQQKWIVADLIDFVDHHAKYKREMTQQIKLNSK